MTTEGRRYGHRHKLRERLQGPFATERFGRLFHKRGTEPEDPTALRGDDRRTVPCVTTQKVNGAPAAGGWEEGFRLFVRLLVPALRADAENDRKGDSI